MGPPQQQIDQGRYWVTVTLRLICLVALVITATHLVLWVTEGVRDRDLLNIRHYYPRIWKSVVFFAVAVSLWLLEGTLARFLIPSPPDR